MARLNASVIQGLANPTGLMKATDKIGESFGGLMKDVQYGKLPNMDATDPASIQQFMDVANARGELSAGQASQLGYQKQGAQATIDAQAEKDQLAADARQARGTVNKIKAGRTALANAETALANAERTGNPEVIAQYTKRLEEIRAGVAKLEDDAMGNPEVQKILADERRTALDLESKELLLSNRKADAAREAETRALNETVATAFGSYLANPEGFSEESAEMRALAASNPTAYGKVIENIADHKEATRKTQDAISANRMMTREEFNVFGDKGDLFFAQYEKSFKAAQGSGGSIKQTNTRFVRMMDKLMEKNLLDGKKADGSEPAMNWTESVRDTAKGTVGATMNVMIAEGIDAITEEESSMFGGVKEVKRDSPVARYLDTMTSDERREFIKMIVGQLEANSVDPTDQAGVRAVVLDQLELLQVDTGQGRNTDNEEKRVDTTSWMSGLSPEDQEDAQTLLDEGMALEEVKAAFGL